MANTSLVEETPIDTSLRGWVRRQPVSVRQFAKFAVVGGTSTALDIGSNWLIWHFARSIPLAMAQACMSVLHLIPGVSPNLGGVAVDMDIVISSGVIGTINAFYWNQRWTFRAAGQGQGMSQVRRFLAVSYSGMAIRAAMVYGFVQMFSGGKLATTRENLVYNCITVVIVMFWNFFLNRAWTFKKRTEEVS